MHENAHDKGFQESRGDMLITPRHGGALRRRWVSPAECDVLEFHARFKRRYPARRAGRGFGSPSRWSISAARRTSHPHADELQLCGQAMCLEEMLCCDIPEGALFYGETKRRQRIDFTAELRREVSTLLAEMHQLARRGYHAQR